GRAGPGLRDARPRAPGPRAHRSHPRRRRRAPVPRAAERPPAPGPAPRRRPRPRPALGRRVPGHGAHAVYAAIPRASGGERREARDRRGRRGAAMARRDHRARARGALRDDAQLLRRHGRPTVRRSLGAGFALVALVAVVAAPPAPRDAATAPSFDAGAAWRDVVRLVELGPRPAGSAPLARARQYIVEELTRAGLQVRLASFEARTPDGPITMA